MIYASRLAALAIAILLVTSGYSASQAANHETGVCNRAAAATLTGKNKISNRRARRLTGATIVRQIGLGDMVTMDYRPERVTIETEPKTRKIVRAFCG